MFNSWAFRTSLPVYGNGAFGAGLKLLVQDAQLNVKQVNLNETLQKGPGSEEAW